MPLNQEQDDQFTKWMLAQNQNDPFAGGQPLAPNVPHGTSVASPTPPIQPIEEPKTPTDPRITDSHPGHKPEDISGEMGARAASLDQYGPDQEKAVYDKILADRGSFGNRAARFGTSLGDAIMSVAGKQSPGFLNSLEGREKSQEELALNKIPTLGKMNMQNMAAKESLEEKDPSSSLSKAAQSAYEGIFQKMGYPPGSTRNKSAQELRTIASLAAQVHGAELEDAVKAAELKLNASRVNAQIENDAETNKLKKESSEQDALKQLGGMAWYNRLLHPGIADKLETQAGLSGEKQPSEGPYGATTIKGGKTYIWSPSTGKYHLQK